MFGEILLKLQSAAFAKTTVSCWRWCEGKGGTWSLQERRPQSSHVLMDLDYYIWVWPILYFVPKENIDYYHIMFDLKKYVSR